MATMRASAWVAPVAWMALILWLGSDGGSAEQTGRLILPALRFLFPSASPLQLEAIHAVVRKLAHLTEYAILTSLWLRAFVVARGTVRERAAWQACAIAVAWAVIDESLQSMGTSRTGSPTDVVIDAVGALVVALPGGFGWRLPLVALTHVALWIAAAGGAALIIVNVVLDVSSGGLWLTVPVAVVALVLLRRARP
jgi:VanZ family protein